MEEQSQHIIDYLEDKLAAGERKNLEDLLDKSPGLQKEFKDIQFIWELSGRLKENKQINTADNWNRLSRRIRTDRYKQKILHVARTAAAVLILPLVITSLILYRMADANEPGPVENIEVSSAYGIVSKLTLPDGSEVWLNSGSTLSYPQHFSGQKRTITLKGEAYFKVHSDQKNRFEVVINDELMVSAYGTEFNVCAYEEEPVVETTLVSGRIEVSTPEDTKAIAPRQQVLFNKATGNMDVAEANLAVKTSWKDGKMVFRRANMTEIIPRLARKFNVDIKLEGEELYEYEYSATFSTESLTDILYLLEKSAPIQCRIIEPEQSEDYSYSKRTVIISMEK